MQNRKLTTLVSDYHKTFASIACAAQSPFLLAVRLYWGWQFAITGWGKLQNLSQITGFFTSLGLPFPAFTAAFVGSVEVVGGVLLVLGLFSRLTGLVLSINMFVAYVTADREALLSIFKDPGKFYIADPYTFLFAALMVLIFGAGFFSLDNLIGRLMAKKQSPELVA